VGNSERKLRRRIAKKIVNWAGVPKKGYSLRRRMAILLAFSQRQQMERARAQESTPDRLQSVIESEQNLTAEAIQARKDADAEVSASEGQ